MIYIFIFFLDCDEVPRSFASILTWLKRREGTAADLIIEINQLEASEELTVVGFFQVSTRYITSLLCAFETLMKFKTVSMSVWVCRN